MGLYIFVMVLIIVASVLQVLIVLVQNSKGGGLAAGLTGTGQAMGIRKTADFLEKATWTLAVSILVLTLFAAAAIPTETKEARSRIQNQINQAVNTDALPVLPNPDLQNPDNK
jgi:preprotein translocase subunit SecG